jgi:hypothetical protein
MYADASRSHFPRAHDLLSLPHIPFLRPCVSKTRDSQSSAKAAPPSRFVRSLGSFVLRCFSRRKQVCSLFVLSCPYTCPIPLLVGRVRVLG